MREKKDGQLTLDRDERAVLSSVIPDSMIVRGATAKAAPRQFQSVVLYEGALPRGDWSAKINHPKLQGAETRLYFESARFSPRAGRAWYIFVRKDGRLCIGSSTERQLQGLKSAATTVEVEDDDESYMERVSHAVQRVLRQPGGDRYKRDASVGLDALKRSGFHCEFDPTHKSFVSQRWDRRYVECHHIVPMFAAIQFPGAALDVYQNVCTLCPNCHKKIHHAKARTRIAMLRNLLKRRPGLLASLGISEEDAVRMYAGANSVP